MLMRISDKGGTVAAIILTVIIIIPMQPLFRSGDHRIPALNILHRGIEMPLKVRPLRLVVAGV